MKRTLLLIVLLLSLTTATSRADITSNLIFWWQLDTGTGTTATAGSGTSYAGTLNGGASWQTGHIGPYCVRTDGTDDYVSCNSTITQANSTAVLTLSAWVYRSATGTKQAFGLSTDELNKFDAIWYTDDNLYFDFGEGAFPYVTSTATGWHHIALVYDNAASPKQKLYLDGVNQSLTGTVTSAATTGATTGNVFWVGRQVSNGFCTGDYDDVRIYNRALSAGDVTELYNYTGAVSIIDPLTESIPGIANDPLRD